MVKKWIRWIYPCWIDKDINQTIDNSYRTRRELYDCMDSDHFCNCSKEHRAVKIELHIKIIVLILAMNLLTSACLAFEGKATYFTVASCIAEGNSGIMASGEPLNDKGYICALPHRRFGGMYLVTNLDNGKSVEVKHLDLGPGKGPRKRGVVIDLSKAAFEDIASVGQGVVRVKVERI